jgi:hypothetical protein
MPVRTYGPGRGTARGVTDKVRRNVVTRDYAADIEALYGRVG